MNRLFTTAFAVLAVLVMANVSSAHTIALGFTNSGPGSVTVWMGTYRHSFSSSPPAEGAISIGGSPVTNFTNTVDIGTPAGLVAGTNLFYAPRSGGSPGQYDQPTNTTGQVTAHWQSVTLSGLSAGLQSYTVSGMNSANWADWNGGGNNWSGTVFVPGIVVNPVPEPTALAIFGLLGVVGLAPRRRKRA